MRWANVFSSTQARRASFYSTCTLACSVCLIESFIFWLILFFVDAAQSIDATICIQGTLCIPPVMYGSYIPY